jgi:transposase-like protein
MDETFVGGKIKNMHRSRRPKGMAFQGGANKVIVIGMLERGGKVRAGVIPDRTMPSMRSMLEANVHADAHIITDEFGNYDRLAKEREHLHEVVEHAAEYVKGHIHTQGIENFWALLKRTISGSYVSVDAAHLNAYVAEQVFRFNLRKKENTDAARFKAVLKDVVGRRLTYAELTGRFRPRSLGSLIGSEEARAGLLFGLLQTALYD